MAGICLAHRSEVGVEPPSVHLGKGSRQVQKRLCASVLWGYRVSSSNSTWLPDRISKKELGGGVFGSLVLVELRMISVIPVRNDTS